MGSKELNQIAAAGLDGFALFPVNPRKMALPRQYVIQKETDGEIQTVHETEHTTAFGVPGATALQILDVQTKAGSEDTIGVRCYTITETPHCSTTHTEGVGHILKTPVAISDVIQGLESKLLRAALITVKPTECTKENAALLHPHAKVGDYVISKESIEQALKQCKKVFFKSVNTLIIRCDHEDFLDKPYHQFKNPPYFSTEAIKYLVEEFEDVGHHTIKPTDKVKIKHIMTNLPSLDPENDEGTLLCHVSFFGAKPNRSELLATTANNKKINPLKRTNTEMVYIPRLVKDGVYFVRNIVPDNNLDHSAGIPLLYDVKKAALSLKESVFFGRSSETYLVDGIKCTRESCAELITKQIIKKDAVHLTKLITGEVELADGTDYKQNHALFLPITHYLVTQVKREGLDSYQKLIDLALNLLDSGVNAERNFDHNCMQFEQDVTAYFAFMLTFLIDRQSPMARKMQEFHVELSRLIFKNVVFGLSRVNLITNARYKKKYGDGCLPKIGLTPSSMEFIDLEGTEKLLNGILTQFQSSKTKLLNTKGYIPEAKAHALGTWFDINHLAQKYLAIISAQSNVQYSPH